MAKKKDDADLGSPVLFRDRFRILERELCVGLDASAKVIMWMVFDRTIGWGKTSERIPLRHFVDGVPEGKTGKCAHRGTGLSRATVVRKLQDLAKCGLISKVGQCEYKIVFGEGIDGMGLLRKSKRVLNAEGSDTKGAQFDNGGCSKRALKGAQFDTPYIREDKEERNFLNTPALRQCPQDSELHHNLQKVEHKTRAKARKRKQQTASIKGLPKASFLAKLWQEQVTSSFPEVEFSTTTQKSMAILRGYAFRFCGFEKGKKGSRLPFEKFSNFMDWSITNWRVIMDNQMDWLDNPPASPDIKFFVGMASHFERAWDSRKQVEASKDLTPREAYYAKQVRNGKTPEVAKKATDERFNVQEEITKLEKVRKRVSVERRALDDDKGRKAEAVTRNEAHKALKRRRVAISKKLQVVDSNLEWKD